MQRQVEIRRILRTRQKTFLAISERRDGDLTGRRSAEEKLEKKWVQCEIRGNKLSCKLNGQSNKNTNILE